MNTAGGSGVRFPPGSWGSESERPHIRTWLTFLVVVRPVWQGEERQVPPLLRETPAVMALVWQQGGVGELHLEAGGRGEDKG